MAMLTYKIMLIQIYHTLWSTYFKSGTGILKAKELPGIKFWPAEVKSLVVKQMANEDKACLASFNYVWIHKPLRHSFYKDLKLGDWKWNIKLHSFTMIITIEY